MNERLVSCIRDRAEELDALAGGMNGLLTARPSKDGAFVHLEILREAIRPGTTIPTLVELQGTQNLVEATFDGIEQEIAGRNLNLPQASDQPGRLASMLLMEGYGLLLEKHFQKPGLRETFVLACEEMLVINLSGSRLFEDVLDQMLGQRELFSPRVQQVLSTYE